jgi:hypothetical protein
MSDGLIAYNRRLIGISGERAAGRVKSVHEPKRAGASVQVMPPAIFRA